MLLDLTAPPTPACALCEHPLGDPVWTEGGRTLRRCAACGLVQDPRAAAGNPPAGGPFGQAIRGANGSPVGAPPREGHRAGSAVASQPPRWLGPDGRVAPPYWSGPPDPDFWDIAHRPMYDAALRALRRLVGRAPRLLDYGAGCGFFLRRALDRGFDASGYEPAAEAVAHGRRHLGLAGRLFVDLGEAAAAAPFDAVTLWDVLEHVADPVCAAREAFSLLRPGGVLLVHTPHVGFHLPYARSLRLLGLGGTMEPGHHLFHFDGRTLPRLLGKAGFAGARPLGLPPVASVGASRARPLVLAKRLYVECVAAPLRALTGWAGGPSLDFIARKPVRGSSSPDSQETMSR